MGELPPTVYELNANRWIFPYLHFIDLCSFPAVLKATKSTKIDWALFLLLTMLPEKIGNWLSADNVSNHLFKQQLVSFNPKKKLLDSIFCSSNCKKIFINLQKSTASFQNI